MNIYSLLWRGVKIFMPRFDRTGPMGMGPMTGKGFGPCGMGKNWRIRLGRGLDCKGVFECWNCPFCSWAGPVGKKEQKKYLKQYKDSLEEELKEIEKEMISFDDNE